MTLLALVLGAMALLAAAAVRFTASPTSGWASGDGVIDARFVLEFLPGLSLVFLGIGLLGISRLFSTPVMFVAAVSGGVLALLGLIAVVYSFLPLPIPRWLLPEQLRSAGWPLQK